MRTFEARDGRTVEAEFVEFLVPERRRDPDSPLIRLAYVRFLSTSENPGPPLVYLAGGPGGSGSRTAQGSRFDLFMAMREVADVIAFDQRGTGASDPLPSCPHASRVPYDEAGTRERLTEMAREVAERCAAFWQAEGVDLGAYTTTASADDLADLRDVLGVPRIDLWGISYGTHLALATMKRHPDLVRRAVLAGVEGLDHTLKLPSDQLALLREIGERSGDAEFVDRMHRVHERLHATPAQVPFTLRDGTVDTLALGAFEVQIIASSYLTGPGTSMQLPSIYQAMEAGDYSAFAGTAPYWPRSLRMRAMSVAMDVASGASAMRLDQIRREAALSPLSDAINFPAPVWTDVLDIDDLGPAFRSAFTSDVPVLFISGTMDGRTPVRNATEARLGFPNSTHLILDGAGHSDPLFLSTPMIETQMKAFLRGELVAHQTVSVW